MEQLGVAVSTNIFGTKPLRQALEAIGAIGISNIEIYGTHLRDIGRENKDIRGLLEQLGLKAVSFHSPTMADDFLGKTDPLFDKQYKNYYHPLFAYAREAGAGICVDHVDKSGLRSSREYDSLKDKLIQNCRSLAELASQYGIVLAMENSSGSEILRTPGQFKEILEGVSHPNFRMNLDVGHALGNKIEPQEFVDQAGGYIVNLHTGNLEIAGLLNKMFQNGYRGNLVLELEEDNLREAFEQMIKRIGRLDMFELDLKKINIEKVPIHNLRWKG